MSPMVTKVRFLFWWLSIVLAGGGGSPSPSDERGFRFSFFCFFCFPSSFSRNEP